MKGYIFYFIWTIAVSMVVETRYVEIPGYNLFYIQEPCVGSGENRNITPGIGGLSHYGFISATPGACYIPNLNCSITLRCTTSGFKFILRFEWIDMDCSSLLEINDGDNTAKFCGHETPKPITSSSGNINVRFVTDSVQSGCQKGFKIYYALTTNSKDYDGDCSDNEFECDDSERCIPEDERCDGSNDCGDWSDEECGLSTGAIVAISVCSVVAGIACLVLIAYCCYRSSHKRPAIQQTSTPYDNNLPYVPTAPPAEPVDPPRYTDVAPPPPYNYNYPN